ncbi:hypothetical protein KCV07_g482, partial [Aureobasidium melanogenum]
MAPSPDQGLVIRQTSKEPRSPRKKSIWCLRYTKQRPGAHGLCHPTSLVIACLFPILRPLHLSLRQRQLGSNLPAGSLAIHSHLPQVYSSCPENYQSDPSI